MAIHGPSRTPLRCAGCQRVTFSSYSSSHPRQRDTNPQVLNCAACVKHGLARTIFHTNINRDAESKVIFLAILALPFQDMLCLSLVTPDITFRIQGRYPSHTSAFSGQDMDPHAEFPGDKIISGFLGPLLGPPSGIPNLPIVTWVQKRSSSLNKWSAKFDSLFTSNTRAFPVMPLTAVPLFAKRNRPSCS